MSTERFTLVLDSTQIDAFCSCPTYWHLNHVESLEPAAAEAKEAMFMGTYGHKLLEIYYKHRAIGESISQATDAAFSYDFDKETCHCQHGRELHTDTVFIATGAGLLDQVPSPKPSPKCQHIGCKCEAFEPIQFPLQFNVRNLVIQRFREYTYTYSNQDIQIESPDHVEVGFSLPLLDTPERLYVLEGRIDVLGSINGNKVFVDHKWQMRKHDLYLRSIQFRNYCLATGLSMGIVNYIRMAQKVDQNTFRRDIINFNKPMQEAWTQELLRIYAQIEMSLNLNAWEKRRSSCPGRYGYECQYTPICDQSNEYLIQQTKQQLYKIKPIWSPWG